MSSTSQNTFLYILQRSDISFVFRQTENAAWCLPSTCHKGFILTGVIWLPLLHQVRLRWSERASHTCLDTASVTCEHKVYQNEGKSLWLFLLICFQGVAAQLLFRSKLCHMFGYTNARDSVESDGGFHLILLCVVCGSALCLAD